MQSISGSTGAGPSPRRVLVELDRDLIGFSRAGSSTLRIPVELGQTPVGSYPSCIQSWIGTGCGSSRAGSNFGGIPLELDRPQWDFHQCWIGI
eukprot:2380067-Pyramimonas_sp.AAC.1